MLELRPYEFWMVWRYLLNRRGQFFNLVSILAIVSMVLGVGSLVVVMAVVSGFETTLQNAVIDWTGHILVLKRGEPLEPLDKLEPRLKKIAPEITDILPFVHVEGMLPHGGKIKGVIVEGFDPHKTEKNLRNRIRSGAFDVGSGLEPVPPVVVGQGLATLMRIKVGDEISVVLPRNSPSVRIIGFKTSLKKFRVSGIIDFGMYEYNTRFLVTSSKAAQDLGGLGPVFTGVRLRLTDYRQARNVSFKLATNLGINYVTHDWFETNQNLFRAIRLEKVVIFVILLFMTLAACFNISSTLFISVLRRFHDISILRTLGASQKTLIRFFSFQGLVIGGIGSVLGLLVGLALCLFLASTNLIYVPEEIYHLKRLPIEIRFWDLAVILVTSFLLCYLSTLMPARRGAKLNPVEGLRYG